MGQCTASGHLAGRRQAMVDQGGSGGRASTDPRTRLSSMPPGHPETGDCGCRCPSCSAAEPAPPRWPRLPQEQLNVAFDQGDTAAGLHQGAPFFLGVYDRQGVIPLEGNRLKVCGGFCQVHLPAGRPEGQDLFPLPEKFCIGPALIRRFHVSIPWSLIPAACGKF